MRAVNLIPPEERRGGHGTPGRSGGAVYILLGALGILVVAIAAYVLTNNSITDKKAELAKVTNDATVAETQAAALGPYRDFASLKQTRATTVASLAASRFDWERVMRQLAIVLPNDVWLTSVVGTVAPGVAFSSGGGAGSAGGTGSLRSAVQSPAIELVGCTTSQAEVSRVMVRLRQLDGVTRVSLGSSEKAANAAGGTSGAGGNGASSGGGGGGSDCRGGSAKFPQFQMVVFFKALAGTPAGGSGKSAAAAAPQTPPSSAQKAKSAVSTRGTP
jgi:Tfp pilus assembly protein PilN